MENKTIASHYLAESSASLMYLTMSNKVQLMGYDGISKYLTKLSNEEYGHSVLFVEHCKKIGMLVECGNVEHKEYPEEICSMFRFILGAEIDIKARLDYLYEEALKERDFASVSFLTEMIKEQIGGVSEAELNYKKCEMAVLNGDMLTFDIYLATL